MEKENKYEYLSEVAISLELLLGIQKHNLASLREKADKIKLQRLEDRLNLKK